MTQPSPYSESETPLKVVQIAACAGADGGYELVALDADGLLWRFRWQTGEWQELPLKKQRKER